MCVASLQKQRSQKTTSEKKKRQNETKRIETKRIQTKRNDINKCFDFGVQKSCFYQKVSSRNPKKSIKVLVYVAFS